MAKHEKQCICDDCIKKMEEEQKTLIKNIDKQIKKEAKALMDKILAMPDLQELKEGINEAKKVSNGKVKLCQAKSKLKKKKSINI